MSEAVNEEFVSHTRYASYHNDLHRVLGMSFGHVTGRCSTSFTNNLEHVTTFSNLDSFCRLDLNLPKRGDNFGKVQTNLLVSFFLFKGDLKDEHKGDLLCLQLAQDYSTQSVEQSRVCLLHCCGITSLILPSQETYREDTRAMLPHCLGDFITDKEQFFSKKFTFRSLFFSV